MKYTVIAKALSAATSVIAVAAVVGAGVKWL
jgi:hypothetical protein